MPAPVARVAQAVQTATKGRVILNRIIPFRDLPVVRALLFRHLSSAIPTSRPVEAELAVLTGYGNTSGSRDPMAAAEEAEAAF